MADFSIGFVVYMPPASLISRMELALSLGYELYIFDNSPTEGTIRAFCGARQGCKYYTSGKNAGLGYGLSAITAQAFYDAWAALLFFDQDTIFDERALNFIEDFYTAHNELSSEYSSICFNSKANSIEPLGHSLFGMKDVLLSINSGSLYFLENVGKLNWFDETFFVDCVDYEFCLRSTIGGLKIALCSNTPGFDHETEQDDASYFVFGCPRRLRKYSTTRIANTIKGYCRLLWRSAVAFNGSYFRAFIRSMGCYLLWQIVVRILIVLPSLGRPRAHSL